MPLSGTYTRTFMSHTHFALLIFGFWVFLALLATYTY